MSVANSGIKLKGDQLLLVLLAIFAVLACIVWFQSDKGEGVSIRKKYFEGDDEDKIRGDWRRVYESVHTSYEKLKAEHGAAA